MGYGSRALQALNSFYSGECLSLDESSKQDTEYPDPTAIEPVSNFFSRTSLVVIQLQF
jgi:N-acetyltransferase 10